MGYGKSSTQLFSRGNIKVGHIPTFSLPSRATCPGCTPTCARLCYAKKAERWHVGVLESRHRNWEATKQADFISRAVEELSHHRGKYIRIHESGDFYDQSYLDKWFEVCSRLPEKAFLAFTSSGHLDFSGKPANLALYASIWADTKKPAQVGRKAFVGIPMPEMWECQGHCDTCLMCFRGERDVYFHIH